MLRVGVVSISVNGFDPHEVASMLDTGHCVQVRSGLHCAPRMHAALGTVAQGGAVRFSLGPFNTLEHIDIALEAVGEIAAAGA
jgi:selenocysteine lyase/cysteine desulfurase